jgi:ABC-2 type transport system permease protein
MTSTGLFFGGIFTNIESFQLVGNFLIWPVFFFSGALFPLTNLPQWLEIVTYLDPLTYGVDALRSVILGMPGAFPLYVDIAALLLFCIPTMGAGIIVFERMGKL